MLSKTLLAVGLGFGCVQWTRRDRSGSVAVELDVG
jgi:hypothetical protein